MESAVAVKNLKDGEFIELEVNPLLYKGANQAKDKILGKRDDLIKFEDAPTPGGGQKKKREGKDEAKKFGLALKLEIT